MVDVHMKKLRDEHNVTLAQVSQWSGVPPATVSRIYYKYHVCNMTTRWPVELVFRILAEHGEHGKRALEDFGLKRLVEMGLHLEEKKPRI